MGLMSRSVTMGHDKSRCSHTLSRWAVFGRFAVTVRNAFVTLSRRPIFAKSLSFYTLSDFHPFGKVTEYHAPIYKKKVSITAETSAPEWARKSAMRASIPGADRNRRPVDAQAGRRLCARARRFSHWGMVYETLGA